MRKEEVKKILQENMEEIKKFGVEEIGIFGSAVRDELKEDSDIDIFVKFKKGRGNMKDFFGLVSFLEKVLGRKVDVLTPLGVKTIRVRSVRERIEREIEYVKEGR